MLSFSLLCLLVCAVPKSAAISLPLSPKNTATSRGSPVANLSGNDTLLELDVSPVWTKSSAGLTIIPNAFDIQITQGPLKINGKSTYMNVLKAMVTLSEKDFLANYPGNSFSFEGYTDMRIQIIRTNSRSAALQYRFAIYGLYSGIYHISKQSKWSETRITLYWSGSGSKTTVGYINFLPWPLPSLGENTQALGLEDSIPASKKSPDLANLTLISDDLDTSGSSNAPQLTISPISGGITLTLPEVFLTIFSALVVIAEPPATQSIRPFSSSESHIDARLEIKDSDPPRPCTWPFRSFSILSCTFLCFVTPVSRAACSSDMFSPSFSVLKERC